MSGSQPKRRVRRRPLKHKPAVVVKRRRLKTSQGPKISLSMIVPKGITKWNIVFTIIFGALLVVTIINMYFKTIFVLPLSDLILNIVNPIILFVEIILVLLAFETYKIKAMMTPLRIILTIITGLIMFPVTLIKYYTRHNIWRVFFAGFTIWTLLFSFFSPYVNLIGKYRDLPEGKLNEQNVNADWFSSLYHGSAPFYIDGLLDLLDALDLNQTLQQQDMAEVTALDGSLGNFLYRWEVYDYYNPTTWEFEGSNDAVLYNPEESDYGRPGATTTVRMQISETVYSATTSLQNSLLTTWSTYYRPHIDKDDDWDDNFYDQNNTAVNAKDGTAKVRFNNRDQLSLTATMTQLGFVGKFQYNTYFASDGDIQQIIQNVVTRDQTNMGTNEFNNTYANFLQIPENYETTSPSVVAYARQKRDDSLTVYQQIVKDLDSILLDFGLPQSAKSDNQGQDRAERLLRGEDKSASAYLALAVMMLRLQGIPARPVFGFAIGEGTSTQRTLKLGNLYGWVEALLPLNEGGELHYRWGQFQIGPYVTSDAQYVYCENTLYSTYNVTIQIFQGSEANEVDKQEYNGEEVYLLDNDVPYIIRAYAEDNANPATNVPISFRAYTVAELQIIQSGQADFSQYGDVLGTATTNSTGYATLNKSFNATAYPLFDNQNPSSTSFVIVGFVTLTSMGFASFIIMPVGYLKPVELNATRLSMPNPQNPLESFDYYILQQGWNYNITTSLYKDPSYTTPLTGRNVTFYLLTQQQLQQLQQTGQIDYSSLTTIGSAKTDTSGVVSITTISNGENKLQGLALNTTYVIAAQYGMGYNFTVIILVDGLRSTVSVNDTLLDISTDGLTIGEQVTGTIYLRTPIGTTDPVENTRVEFWIIPDDPSVYNSYDGTMNATEYKQFLISQNSTYANPPPYKIRILGQTTTNSSGGYSFDFVLNATLLGVGSYRIIVFYEDRWNASATIYIQSPPGLLVSNTNGDNTVREINIGRHLNKVINFYVWIDKRLDFSPFLIGKESSLHYTAAVFVFVLGVIILDNDLRHQRFSFNKKGL